MLVLTTSGTAAAELHPAVVEADLAGVPLIVCTADRPPELHEVGAAQTIDQLRIFGRAPRASFDLGVPDEATRARWRPYAARLVAESMHGPRGPGPVHANLPFRDPLTGALGTAEAATGRGGGDLASGYQQVTGPGGASAAAIAAMLEITASARGVVLAGGGAGAGAGVLPAIVELAALLGWPVLADPRAWPRRPFANVVAAGDGILRAAAGALALRPEVVVHVGAPHASQVIAGWCRSSAAAGTEHVLIDPFGRYLDPDRLATRVIVADPTALAEGVLEQFRSSAGGRLIDDAWIASWQRAELAAQHAIDELLATNDAISEPALARRLFALLPPESTVVASSSMPIRDLEWFAKPRADAPRVLANRGANGIDGVTSTVLGVAAARSALGGPVVGLVGDLAFLHDVSALVWGRDEVRPDAVIVVVDNDGGGIFNFLGYAAALEHDVFERGFATAQSCEIATVARAFGCSVIELDSLSGFDEVIEKASGTRGITVVVAATERRSNVELHGALNAAIAAAVDAALAD